MRHLRVWAACALSATAFSIAPTTACAQPADGFGPRDTWRPFVGLGFTSGGDTLMKVDLVPEGSSTRYREDISSGGGIDLRFGVSRRLGEWPLTLQLVAAYHNDQANGIRGEKIRFRRIPVEATLLWHATERTRIGFGVRKATHPTFKLDNIQFDDGAGGNITVSGKADLKAKLAYIVEAEYALTPSWGLKGRYVFESFRPRNQPDGEQFEANHLGVMSVWYFD